MKKACLLLFLFLAIGVNSQENKKADSLVGIFHKTTQVKAKDKLFTMIGSAYGIDSPKGLLWYKKGKAFALANKLDPSVFTDAIGIHHLNKQQYDIAFDYFLEAAEEARQHGNKRMEAIVYDHISIIFDEQEQLPKAMGYLRKSITINTERKDNMSIADNYMSLGIIRSKMSQEKEAASDFKRALKMYTPYGDIEKIAYAYFNMGMITNNLPQRLDYFKKAQTLWDEYDPKFVIAVSNRSNLAETLLYISRDAALATRINSTTQELIEKAESEAAAAITYSKEGNNLYNLMYSYEVMAKIQEEKNQDSEALHYTRLQNQLKDSIFSQDSKNKIAAIENERQIAVRDKAIALNKITLQAKEKQLLYLFIGLLLFTAVVAMLYLQSRARRENNERLQKLNSELDEANKMKTRLFGIINHDLRSPVSSLISFLFLQKEGELNPDKKDQLEAKTIASAENLLLVMEDLLLWSKGQMEKFSPDIKPVSAETLFTDLKNFYDGNTSALLIFSDEETILFDTDENYLKTIMRNLTANALKAVAGKPGAVIEWKAWQEDGHRYLRITDNGKGATTDALNALYDDTRSLGGKTGLGLHLIRDLSKAIGCHIAVETAPNQGTTITLTVNP